VLLGCSAILSGCSLGPTIDCRVPLADCRHAVAIARPLIGPTWDEAAEVMVYPGGCIPGWPCPEPVGRNPQLLTVELRIANVHDVPFVRIDRSTGTWEGTCAVVVTSENEAHTEGCSYTSVAPSWFLVAGRDFDVVPP
jgi:hypothetical protein